MPAKQLKIIQHINLRDYIYKAYTYV